MNEVRPGNAASMTPPSAAGELAQRYRRDAPRAPDRTFSLLEVFPANARIELEIGFGRGLFLGQRSEVVKDSYLWGIEIKRKLAYQVAQRCKLLGCERIAVMAGDVRGVLSRATPDAILERAFMHFPDPWWKKRHAKRRLCGPELLDQLARLLKPGGEFFIQTDVQERAEEALAALRAHSGFTLTDGGALDANPYGALSNRERRAIADGLPIYRILAFRSTAVG